MTESALPFPTPNRLKLADAIAAGQVRHYPFHRPETFNQTNGNAVTAKVQLLLAAGLVEVPEPDEHNYSIVRLTPSGEEWSGFKNRTGWRDEATGLVSGGLVASCSACGSMEHDRHPLGEEDYREAPYHFGEMEQRRPACTCPPIPANLGSRENRGHLLGCPTLGGLGESGHSTEDGD